MVMPLIPLPTHQSPIVKMGLISDFHADKVDPKTSTGRTFVENILLNTPINEDGSRYACVCGDISGDLDHSISFLQAMAAAHPDVNIVFLAGNHEFLKTCDGTMTSAQTAFTTLREGLSGFANLHLIDETSYYTPIINGQSILFAGNVGWWDFRLAATSTTHQSQMRAAFQKVLNYDDNSFAEFCDTAKTLVEQAYNTLKAGLEQQPTAVVYMTHTLSDKRLIKTQPTHNTEDMTLLHQGTVGNSLLNKFDDALRRYGSSVRFYAHTHEQISHTLDGLDFYQNAFAGRGLNPSKASASQIADTMQTVILPTAQSQRHALAA